MKVNYSENTKRRATQFPGVYERNAERVRGEMDVVYDISYKKDGKKIWEKVGWKSQGYTSRLAKTVRDARIRTMQHGEELPQEKAKAPFLKEAWKDFYAWAKGNKVRDAIDDFLRYEKHIEPYLADKRLNEIHPLDLERLRKRMADGGLAPATQRHVLTIIREIYNKTTEWKKYDGTNPTREIIKKIVVNNERERFLSFKEARRILDYFRESNPDVHDICLMSFFCGLRFGEVAGIKCGHINMEKRTIAIMDTKNKTNRHADINDMVQAVVAKRMSDKPEAYLFPDKYGKRRGRMPNAFHQGIKKLGFNTGVKDNRQKIVFHSARHSFASWLVEGGESLYMTGMMLGQKSPEMTKRYAHCSPEHKSKVSSGLANRFNESSQKENIILMTEPGK